MASTTSVPWGFTQKKQITFNTQHPNATDTSSILDSFLSKMPSLISTKNGKALSQHLSFRQCSESQLFHQISKSDLRTACTRQLPPHIAPWHLILPQHLESHYDALHSRHLQSWQSALSSLKSVRELIICKVDRLEHIWFLAAINTVLKHCSECAIACNSNLSDLDDEEGVDSDQLSKRDVIVQTLQEIFLLIRGLRDSENDALSRGLFFCVNQAIRLCDVINNTVFLDEALDAVKRFEKRWNEFPRSEIVTHLYYKGRHCFRRGGVDLMAAKEDLARAYALCLDESLNKTRILLLLIPIQMTLGYLPNLDALAPPLRERFDAIVCALKTGNLLLFKMAMDRYEDDFIHCGIYMMLCKLELLVFRALVIKVFTTRQRMKDIKAPNKIKLREIKAALDIRSAQCRISEFEYLRRGNEDNAMNKDNAMVHDIDEDEIECLLSTLIWKRLIGGYVAHKIACVLSADPKKAFPPIKMCRNWWCNDF